MTLEIFDALSALEAFAITRGPERYDHDAAQRVAIGADLDNAALRYCERSMPTGFRTLKAYLATEPSGWDVARVFRKAINKAVSES